MLVAVVPLCLSHIGQQRHHNHKQISRLHFTPPPWLFQNTAELADASHIHKCCSMYLIVRRASSSMHIYIYIHSAAHTASRLILWKQSHTNLEKFSVIGINVFHPIGDVSSTAGVRISPVPEKGKQRNKTTTPKTTPTGST